VLIRSAEDSYERGLRAFAEGRRMEALALFEAAIEIERRHSHVRPQPRYLSHYGMCLALERNDVREGLLFCREAVTLEGYNPDLRCNLGHVLLRAERRAEAYRCFLKGLSLDPHHAPTLRALRKLGIRRRPVLPFLARGNPLNVFLGRLRKAS
jgi:tetratricopeptide (TPR) repeat protein